MTPDLTKVINALLMPAHPISICLVGCGGTGAEVLRWLAKMNGAMIEFGHPGFHVTVSDPDVIGRENLFRQPFTERELNLNKASQLVSKINRSYGTQWQSIYLDWEHPFVEDKTILKSEFSYNITISCVDNIKTRKQIYNALLGTFASNSQSCYRPFFWMDFGNGFDFGQVILSDIVRKGDSMPPYNPVFKRVFDIYPDAQDEPEEPSCSLAISLGKQGLFINGQLAVAGMEMFWNLLRHGKIEYNAIFVNQKSTTPIRKALMLNKKEEIVYKPFEIVYI
jgi:PRTRC genetic system ThiF family protein